MNTEFQIAQKGRTNMKARTRLLASFLALLLCLSPVTVWASPEAPRPSHVVDLALSDTAESQLCLLYTSDAADD